MSKDNGGPAFPWCGDLNDCPTINLAMDLRDYFAAKAMQAIISNDLMIQRLDRWPGHSGAQPAAAISKESYIIADAMLVERAK